MHDEEEKLRIAIENAVKLHGHLGPFLVIGVRIGQSAERMLTLESGENKDLTALAKVPLLTPFSCVLDGIQVITQCTVGNQKLRIENSQEDIAVYFKLQNSSKALKIAVNPKIIEELMSKISKGASNQELAREIAHMPDNQLFSIEKE